MVEFIKNFFKCNLKLRTITAKLRIGKEGMKVRNALIVAVLLIAVLFAFKLLAMPEVEVSDIDLSKVRDGSYIGEYKAGPVKAVVQVDVKDQQIADIKIKEHVHSIGKNAEGITKQVLAKQSLAVDAVSGATVSSNVILKAVQVALEKGTS